MGDDSNRLIVDVSMGTQGRASATFDRDRRYRYRLSRAWAGPQPRVVWCMLNPSHADATLSDRTLDRVIGFSKSWGYGAAEVVNLFAWRSSDPRELKSVADPVGRRNDEAIVDAVLVADEVIVAWGNHGTIANPNTGIPRCQEVMSLFSRRGVSPRALGFTKRGQPRHPLYLPSDSRARGLEDNGQDAARPDQWA